MGRRLMDVTRILFDPLKKYTRMGRQKGENFSQEKLSVFVNFCLLLYCLSSTYFYLGQADGASYFQTLIQ